MENMRGGSKNGKTLNINVLETDYHFIDSMFESDVRNCIICANELNDPSQIIIEKQCVGGWKTSPYNKVFALKTGEHVKLVISRNT